MIKRFLFKFCTFPLFLMYYIYDYLYLKHINELHKFKGFGIHLYLGLFGQGKTCSMVYDAYKLSVKHKELNILTNVNLQNFPEHTNILKLNSAEDIINAPDNTLVLIDEVGTIFNSRDFSSGKSGISKSLFQHLCQCRKRNISIWGTVQRYNLLDKQIRDITSDVTVCHSSPAYPYTRYITSFTYDIDEYEMYMSNRSYQPKYFKTDCFFQTNFIRSLYDTSQLIDDMLRKKYISDNEILRNRGDIPYFATNLSKKEIVDLKKRKKI